MMHLFQPAVLGNRKTEWMSLLALLLVLIFGQAATAQVVKGETTLLRAPPPPEEGEEPFNDSRLVGRSVPNMMITNGLYNLSVTMQNTGTLDWSASSGYEFAQTPASSAWEVTQAPNRPTYVLNTYGNVKFDFQVRAPSTPGTYILSWQMRQYGQWFGGGLFQQVTVREPINNAQVLGQNVPTQVYAGQRHEITVTMQNNGDLPWTRAQQYTLMAQAPHNNMTWGLNRVPLPVETVNPGESATFRFTVTAPATAGSYASQWGMQREGYGSFGASTNEVWVDVQEPINDAQPVAQDAPTQMVTGRPYNVSVTMLNNGESTWTRDKQYTLMAQSPHNNTTWGFNRVPLPIDNIAPGQSATFNFQVTAPSTPGSYVMQWGMQREYNGSFGPGTTPITINVAAPYNNAQVVSVNVPARMQTKLGYNVAVTMRNTGTTTWAAGVYTLGSENPIDNFTWGLARVALGTPVAPGQEYTFNFPVTAPAAGEYTMQWRMLSQTEWFGGVASSPVTVTEDLSRVTFIHTDGLGSPVARTDGAGNVVSRTRYEPYGFVASGATPTIGFTGHMNDADTGLTYMQQRYYDPVAGRFLSIDPVTTNANTGGGFNRYAYVLNNPYRYIDPDGREAEQAIKTGIKIVLKLKDTWTRAQVAAAEKKAAHLDSLAKQDLLKKTESASGPSASKIFKGEKPKGSDIDHKQDKQLGGHPTDQSNLEPLDFSVNRSFGSQIGTQLRKVPVGTMVTAVSILYADAASAMTNITLKDVANGITDFIVDPVSTGGCGGSGKCSSEMYDPKTGP